jgi:hypothetical protein
MLKVFQRFNKHCRFHLQGECVFGEGVRKPYIHQAVGGELDAKDLIGGTED